MLLVILRIKTAVYFDCVLPESENSRRFFHSFAAPVEPSSKVRGERRLLGGNSVNIYNIIGWFGSFERPPSLPSEQGDQNFPYRAPRAQFVVIL